MAPSPRSTRPTPTRARRSATGVSDAGVAGLPSSPRIEDAVPTRRRGYSLLEVILVVAVIALVAALFVPTLENLYNPYKTQEAADSVRAAWALARTHAMEEGRSYRFAVVPGRGNFRVAPDEDEFWTGSDPE